VGYRVQEKSANRASQGQTGKKEETTEPVDKALMLRFQGTRFWFHLQLVSSLIVDKSDKCEVLLTSADMQQEVTINLHITTTIREECLRLGLCSGYKV